MEYRLSISKNQSFEPRLHGFETGKLSLEKSEKSGYIVLKEKGHSYWSGLNMPRSYSPLTYRVMKILSTLEEGEVYITYLVEQVTSFSPIKK